MTSASTRVSPARPLKIGLWAAQGLLCILFCGAGITKLTASIAALAVMMPWTATLPVVFVRSLGAIDLAGGLGVLLPSLTRIMPRLTVAAALGCTALQILAMGFHVSRGEVEVLPLNAVLLSLSLFVLWGRSRGSR